MHIHPRALVAIALTLGLVTPAAAETPRAGEVSRVEGTAAVARSTTPEATPLKSKDSVFYRDLVSTGEQSKAQLLLGGKATVTMREQSRLRITEVPASGSPSDRTAGRLQLSWARDSR